MPQLDQSFLAAARSRADRARRRRRLVTAMVSLLLIVAVGASVTVVDYNNLAEARLKVIKSDELAAASVQAMRLGDGPHAVQKAVAAWQAADTPQSRGALLAALTVTYVGSLPGQTKYVVQVLVSPDNQTIATAQSDGVVRVHDATTHQLRRQLIEAGHGFRDMAFAPDGTLVTSLGGLGIQAWNISTGTARVVADVTGAVAVSPDGRWLAVGILSALNLYEFAGHDQLAAVFTTTGALPSLSMPPEQQPAQAVAFSRDGNTVATVGQPQAGLWLWDAADAADAEKAYTANGNRPVFGQAVRTIPLPGDTVTERSVAYDPFSPDGRTLAALLGPITRGSAVMAAEANPGWLARWDVPSAKLLGVDNLGANVMPGQVRFAPNGELLALSAVGTHDLVYQPVVEFRDPHTGALRAQLPVPGTTAVGIVPGVGIAFSPDSRTLAVTESNSVRLWNVADRTPIGAPLTGHTEVVRAMAFSPDGRTLVSASADHIVRLWDVAIKQVAAVILPGTGASALNDVDFSPDGQSIACATADEVVPLDINPKAVLEHLHTG